MENIGIQIKQDHAQNQPLSGLDYLQAISDGKIYYPPLLQALIFKAISVTQSQAIFSFIPHKLHYNDLVR